MHIPRPRGGTFIYFLVALVPVIGLVSLGVDLGRAQVAKAELRRAADAAALYGATGIATGTAISRTITGGSDNKVDGVSLVLKSEDVTLGNWNRRLTPRFHSGRSPINAVQVRAVRAAERSTAIPLVFGSLIGVHTCDIYALATAKAEPILNGFIGLDGVSAKNNIFSGGYYSPENTAPGIGGARGPGMLGSNAAVSAANNEAIGQLVLGPSGSHNLTVNSMLRLTSPIPVPSTDLSAAPSSNPGGVGTVLNIGSGATQVLPGGTYYFTEINLGNNAELRFAGPATIYLNGSVNVGQVGTITAFESVPANLYIRQRGAGTVFGSEDTNSLTVVAAIDAPETSLLVKNTATLYGRAIFKLMESKNNLELFYDEALEAALPDMTRPYSVVLVN